MIRQVFNQQELPVDALEKIHLAKNGELLLDKDDLDALLAGRRTDMLRMEDLELDGMHIDLLDAKLSLQLQPDGTFKLLFHPIRLEPEGPSFLTDTQAEMLEKGDIPNVQKRIFGDDGKPKEVLIEYDKDTHEFIITDTDKIQAPDMINGKPLTSAQKDKYRKGKEVKTEDGTTIQYAGTEKQGIRSDKLALIASIIIDGGVSYMVCKGLHALFGKKQDKEHGSNYQQALKAMQKEEPRQQNTVLQPGEDFEEETAQTMGR